MPNIKSAKKRVLVIEKKTMRNKAIKSALKTQVKKFLSAVEAGDKELATKLFPETVSAIDAARISSLDISLRSSSGKSILAQTLPITFTRRV